MPRYGSNLHELFRKRNAHFTAESIYSLGIQIINIFEQIHEAGFVYNALKLDNLFLDYGISTKNLLSTDEDIFNLHHINIV